MKRKEVSLHSESNRATGYPLKGLESKIFFEKFFLKKIKKLSKKFGE